MRTPNWIDDLFTALDDADVDTFCSYLTDDVEFVYASECTVSGHDAVYTFVQSFVDSIQESDHDIQEVISTPTRTVIRGEVDYIRDDGSELHVPFANIFEMEEGKIDVYQVYVDQEL